MIGLKILPSFLNESKVEPKPIVAFSHAFSLAWHRVHVFASSSDWFIGLSASVVIGQSNYFSFGFTEFNGKLLSYVCGIKWWCYDNIITYTLYSRCTIEFQKTLFEFWSPQCGCYLGQGATFPPRCVRQQLLETYHSLCHDNMILR